MKNFTLLIFLGTVGLFRSQIGIGTTTPHPSAVLEVSSQNKGLQLPVVNLNSTDDLSTVPSPIKGFMVYNLSQNGSGETAVSKGVYSFDGERWHKILSRQNSTDKIMQIPFLSPMFVASNIVSSNPSPINNGITVPLTFNKLDFNYNNGATGTAPEYKGFIIQEDGIYTITFSAEIRNTSGDSHGEQIFFIRSNNVNVCHYGMERKFQFGGISNNCTIPLSQGDEVNFAIRSTGSAYQIYNTNVSIYQSF
ncbi:MAG: hypothetical protein LBF27_33170 [Sphingobacterium sp.]|nr:hypothetical protein [Sphingobacterium sp.]